MAPNVGFSPQNITLIVEVNSTVTWTDNDDTVHTVTANDESFDSGILIPGGTSTYTFMAPRAYEYHCRLHQWMIGYVTVKSA